MSKKQTDKMTVDYTPLEKIESVFTELVGWYGEAENKELRVAAKLLMVSLDKFAAHGGAEWQQLVSEYIDILQEDPEKFQKIMESNRGGLKGKSSKTWYH